ncbi:hypothetical protein U9M48_000393, partial [Paspalum notatum var. saurae]
MGPAADDLGLTQIIVHDRPSSAASMQLLDLFNDGLLLLLSLSLSPASKAIAKGGARHHHHHRRSSRADDDDGGAFRCRTCGRRFATFQALGGHRTSHKRPRVRADGLDLLLGARPGKGAAASDVHRCHACGVVFPTGQALGGHMRKHRAAFEFDVAVAGLETVPATTESAESLEELTLSCGSSNTSTTTSSIDEASAARPPPSPPRRRRRRRRRRGQEEAFACRTCGRQFATFQALGGHRTSHLRLRRLTTKPTKAQLAVAHACATCGLRFSTGQALGGHMRRHRGLGLPAAADQDCGGFVDLAWSTDRPSSASLHLLNLF